MKVEMKPARFKLRCDVGVCRNVAAHVVLIRQQGQDSEMYICPECRKTLAAAFAEPAADTRCAPCGASKQS
ncbi:MAG: hypothetical protein LBM78_02440 [Clostridiales bacterium]|jgi:hypothetical protein|nr:hypothetical protein [Clostridiales bacterium]